MSARTSNMLPYEIQAVQDAIVQRVSDGIYPQFQNALRKSKETHDYVPFMKYVDAVADWPASEVAVVLNGIAHAPHLADYIAVYVRSQIQHLSMPALGNGARRQVTVNICSPADFVRAVCVRVAEKIQRALKNEQDPSPRAVSVINARLKQIVHDCVLIELQSFVPVDNIITEIARSLSNRPPDAVQAPQDTPVPDAAPPHEEHPNRDLMATHRSFFTRQQDDTDSQTST